MKLDTKITKVKIVQKGAENTSAITGRHFLKMTKTYLLSTSLGKLVGTFQKCPAGFGLGELVGTF